MTGTVSDKDGNYILKKIPQGDYTIKVTHMLYNQELVKLRLINDLLIDTIELSHNTIALNQVVVTPNFIENRSDRYIVSLQNNLITKGNSADEVLQLMPGITKQNKALKVNGFDVADIYVNDRKLRDRTELDLIKAEDIDRVEIIYSTGSEYDAAMFGSIIKIYLNKVPQGGYYGSLKGSASVLAEEGINSGMLSNLFNYRYKKVSIYNSIYYMDQDPILDNNVQTQYLQTNRYTDMTIRDRGWAHMFSENLSLTYDLNDKHSIGTNFRLYLLNRSPHETSETKLSDNSEPSQELSKSDIRRKVDNDQYQGTLNYNWKLDNKGSKFRLIADYMNYDNQNNKNYTSIYDINTSPRNEYMINNLDQKTNMFVYNK